MSIRIESDQPIDARALSKLKDLTASSAVRSSVKPSGETQLILVTEGALPDLSILPSRPFAIYSNLEIKPEDWGSESMIRILNKVEADLGSTCAARGNRSTRSQKFSTSLTVGFDGSRFVRWSTDWDKNSSVVSNLRRGLEETGIRAVVSKDGRVEGQLDGAITSQSQSEAHKTASFRARVDVPWGELFRGFKDPAAKDCEYFLRANTDLGLSDHEVTASFWSLIASSGMSYGAAIHQIWLRVKKIEEIESLLALPFDLRADADLGWLDMGEPGRVRIGFRLDTIDGARLVLSGSRTHVARVQSSLSGLTFSKARDRTRSGMSSFDLIQEWKGSDRRRAVRDKEWIS